RVNEGKQVAEETASGFHATSDLVEQPVGVCAGHGTDCHGHQSCTEHQQNLHHEVLLFGTMEVTRALLLLVSTIPLQFINQAACLRDREVVRPCHLEALMEQVRQVHTLAPTDGIESLGLRCGGGAHR